MTNFRDSFWGPNGFEELKKYSRFGNEFCRELASILAEKSEAELNYSKSLHKTGQRLQKLSKDFIGGLANAWFQVSLQFDTEAELHKSLSNALHDEIIRPLKSLIENQIKARKPIELNVEKAIRVLSDRRAKDYKYRLRCYKTVKDIENVMYSLDEAQKGINGKPPKQKEIQKLQDQLKHLQNIHDKSEIKYYKACGSVELARQDWQLSMCKGCDQIQKLDEQRISQLDILLKRYTHQIGDASKKIMKMFDSLQKLEINVEQDIELASKKYGTGGNVNEIYLFDIYSENTKNMMNRDRRIANLNKWSTMLQNDIQSQIKCTEGLDKVRNFQKENPKFANNEEDIKQKLRSIELMHVLYEGSLFKINSALCELHGQEMPTYKFAKNLHLTYDKLGVPISILKLDVKNVSPPPSPARPTSSVLSLPLSNTSTNTSISLHSIKNIDSNSNGLSTIPAIIQMPQPQLKNPDKLNNYYKDSHPPSYKESISFPLSLHKRNLHQQSAPSLDSDDDEWNASEYISRCVANYDYNSGQDGDLSMKNGDVVNVLEKLANGWWRGDLNGSIGLFPSTFVTEIQIF